MPPYMDIHLSYALRNAIRQPQTSSHQLEIEVGKYARIPLEERIWQLFHQEFADLDKFSFYEIRGRYHCLFKESFGPLRKVMEYEDQWCLGLFLLELKRHRQKLLDNSIATQGHPQRTITTFFSPIAPTNTTRQSRATQMGAKAGHSKGVSIDRAITICHARRHWPH